MENGNINNKINEIKEIISMFDSALSYNCVILNFKKFIEQYSFINKWGISSDYSFNGNIKTIAFSIFPYDELLSNTIKENIPRDLKKTRDIESKTIEFLKKSERFFNFIFIINDDMSIDYKNLYKDTIDIIRQTMIDKNTNIKYSKRLRKYNSNSFSKELFSKIHIISIISSYLMSLVLRLQPKVAYNIWIPDRGPSISTFEGLLIDMYSLELNVLKQIYNAKQQKYDIITKENKKSNKYEFDSFIRLPDYFAGIVAAFDGTNNETDTKFYTLFKNTILNNSNVSITKVNISNNNLKIEAYNIHNI